MLPDGASWGVMECCRLAAVEINNVGEEGVPCVDRPLRRRSRTGAGGGLLQRGDGLGDAGARCGGGSVMKGSPPLQMSEPWNAGELLMAAGGVEEAGKLQTTED